MQRSPSRVGARARRLLWVPLLCLAWLTAPARALDLGDYAGKVVVLDFWASWCSPCLKSFPWMNTMQAKYADQGLIIIAVNVDADRQDAAAFLDKAQANFRIVYDTDGELARAYGVVAMPTSFVIDRQGNIAVRHRGFKIRKRDEYEAALRRALGDVAAAPVQAPVSHTSKTGNTNPQ